MSWTGIMTRKQNYLPFMALSPVTILVTMINADQSGSLLHFSFFLIAIDARKIEVNEKNLDTSCNLNNNQFCCYKNWKKTQFSSLSTEVVILHLIVQNNK